MVDLKFMLRNSQLSIGSWLHYGEPSIAETMAQAGFEWLTIDLEHGAIPIDTAKEMIRVIELSNVVPLVRVSENSPTIIKQVMDAGSHGVIVPMVNTGEEAEAAVSSVKYPPLGSRGVGLARAQKYGFGFEEYKKWVEESSVVIAQIEHIKAVENLKEILTTEGIDGFIIGPYDLSGSLGVPGDFSHPRVVEALNEVRRISQELKMASGYHVVSPKPELVKEKIGEGYTFIAYGVDFLFLGETCRKDLKIINNFK